MENEVSWPLICFPDLHQFTFSSQSNLHENQAASSYAPEIRWGRLARGMIQGDAPSLPKAWAD